MNLGDIMVSLNREDMQSGYNKFDIPIHFDNKFILMIKKYLNNIMPLL